MKCPYCGQEHPDNSKFCSETGKPLQSQTKKCEKCGYENVPIEAKFCPRCGAKYNINQYSCDDNKLETSQVIISTITDGGSIICKDDRETKISLNLGDNIIDVNSYPCLKYGWRISKDTYNIASIDLCNFNASQVVDMSQMFLNCFFIESLNFDKFITSHVEYMSWMFNGCRSLKQLDLARFDTSHVTMMNKMFDGCSSLESINLSGFNTSQVFDMISMFADCNSLKHLDLSSFNTQNVDEMRWMFRNCYSLETLDLSGFDTSNVLKMEGIFTGCSSLKEIMMRNCNEYTIEKITNALEEENINGRIITD